MTAGNILNNILFDVQKKKKINKVSHENKNLLDG